MEGVLIFHFCIIHTTINPRVPPFNPLLNHYTSSYSHLPIMAIGHIGPISYFYLFLRHDQCGGLNNYHPHTRVNKC